MTPSSPLPPYEILLKKQRIVRSKDLEAAGLSRTAIRRLTERGALEKVGHGQYRSAKTQLSERADLVQASRRLPGGVICLLSALRFHGLTTQNPFEVWMAIPSKAWRPRVGHPALRLIFLPETKLQDGVEEREVDGVAIKVFSAAKTVVDCFRFRNTIGIDVAVESLREYRRLHPKKLEAIWRFAESSRMTKVMAPYLESLA